MKNEKCEWAVVLVDWV